MSECIKSETPVLRGHVTFSLSRKLTKTHSAALAPPPPFTGKSCRLKEYAMKQLVVYTGVCTCMFLELKVCELFLMLLKNPSLPSLSVWKDGWNDPSMGGR